jgi:hypothetical protein
MTGHLLSILLGSLAATGLGASCFLIHQRLVRPWFEVQIRRAISMARERPAKVNVDLLNEFVSAHRATSSKLNELRSLRLPHRPIFATDVKVESRAEMPSAKVVQAQDPSEERVIVATDVWDVVLEVPEAQHLFSKVSAPLLSRCLPGLEFACIGSEKVLDTVTSATDAMHVVLRDLKAHLFGFKFSYIVPLIKQWRLLSHRKTTALKAAVQSFAGVVAIGIFSTLFKIGGAVGGAMVGDPASGMVAGGVIGTRFALWIVKGVNYLRLRWRASRLNRYVKVARLQIEEVTGLAIRRCEEIRAAANRRWEQCGNRAAEYVNRRASRILERYEVMRDTLVDDLMRASKTAASKSAIQSALRAMRGRLDSQQRLALLFSPRSRSLLSKIVAVRARRISKLVERATREQHPDARLESILGWLAANPVASQSTLKLIEDCQGQPDAFKREALAAALRMTQHLVKCRGFLSRRVKRAEGLAQRQLTNTIEAVRARYDKHRHSLQDLADSVGIIIIFSQK